MFVYSFYNNFLGHLSLLWQGGGKPRPYYTRTSGDPCFIPGPVVNNGDGGALSLELCGHLSPFDHHLLQPVT